MCVCRRLCICASDSFMLVFEGCVFVSLWKHSSVGPTQTRLAAFSFLFSIFPHIIFLCVVSCAVSSVGGRVRRFLEHSFVFVLVVLVWPSLGCGVCVFGKFLRVTGQVLIARGSLCACACVNTCACHSVGHQSFPTIVSAVNSSVGLFQ